jgi:hypothetical protein
MNDTKNTKVYVFREHNYGTDHDDTIDVCGDLVVCSTLEKAREIAFEKLKNRCGVGNSMVRKWFISETNMRPDFPLNINAMSDNEINTVIDEELKSFDSNLAFYIRLYVDYPDNEGESLAFVIEEKIIDNIDVF